MPPSSLSASVISDKKSASGESIEMSWSQKVAAFDEINNSRVEERKHDSLQKLVGDEQPQEENGRQRRVKNLHDEEERRRQAAEYSQFHRQGPLPVQLKGGLTDRSLFSWIRILVLTCLWWCLVAGFSLACFTLMSSLLHPGQDSQPYFVRNQAKFPAILDQPGLAINCTESGPPSCHISLNKILVWQPQPWDLGQPVPTIQLQDGRSLEIKEQLKLLGQEDLGDFVPGVFVTCQGKTKLDQSHLAGMKLLQPGFQGSVFPWKGEGSEGSNSLGRRVVLEMGEAMVVQNQIDSKEAFEQQVRVTLQCQAWARNILNLPSFVDSHQPRGGVAAVICFKERRIEPC